MIRPIKVEYLEEYKCNVKFNNNESGVIDFSFLLSWNKMYKQLNNIDLFKTIRISEDGMCIEWDEDLDLCPDVTYNEFIKQNKG